MGQEIQKKLPQRTPEHDTDTEAMNALRAAAQGDFIVRTDDPDYGLDGELEIVVDGSVTNRRVGFQLKGTAQPWKRGSARSVAIEQSTHQYLQQARYPVLIIRYSTQTKCLYFRWVHDHDAYYQTGRKPRFTFSEADKWTEDTPAHIRDTWAIFERVRTGRLPRPIPLSISLDRAIPNARIGQLRAALTTAFREAGNVFSFARAGEQGTLRVRVHADAIEANLHLTGCTVHMSENDLASEMPVSAGADIALACAGVALSNVGSTMEAAEVFLGSSAT